MGWEKEIADWYIGVKVINNLTTLFTKNINLFAQDNVASKERWLCYLLITFKVFFIFFIFRNVIRWICGIHYNIRIWRYIAFWLKFIWFVSVGVIKLSGCLAAIAANSLWKDASDPAAEHKEKALHLTIICLWAAADVNTLERFLHHLQLTNIYSRGGARPHRKRLIYSSAAISVCGKSSWV